MHQSLEREMGIGGAIVTGLGSILGTGAFVAIGVASGMWGDAVLLAIPIAGLVAVFNGLSSAYLAGRFPVAGGTYEYGYQALGPWWGFSAGWLFLLAKTASAATAALGVALYLGIPGDRRIVAIVAVTAVTLLVLAGLKRTTVVNTVLVILTVGALITFALAGIAQLGSLPSRVLFWRGGGLTTSGLLPAIAFIFLAYTGYGRIATMGEEVHRPARTIPRAVIVTLVVATTLYALVEIGGRAIAGSSWGLRVGRGTTPADLVAQPFSTVVTIGAVTAMLGVLVNLVLGLSRVWLAMGRRLDMPEPLARLDRRSVPVVAIITAAVPIAVIALIGDISLAWTFSAFTVLLYYGITNLAALRLDRGRWTAWVGLLSCLFLSFFVPVGVWMTGTGLIAVGLIWKTQRRF
ncbi:MAG TPA: APC family permease [Acidimicrobiia bacterium]|nr:APC family permease [Acidimicrobiia bacterium]